MRHSYPSDISRKQFKKIASILRTVRKTTKPNTIDLYDIFCGVLYVLKGGIQWRMLPTDFPSWQTCYAYFQKWSEKEVGQHSALEVALKKVGWRGPLETGAGSKTHAADR
jgi:transposase